MNFIDWNPSTTGFSFPIFSRSIAVQQAPRLHNSPFNNNLHASSTFSTTCNSHKYPVPYSPMTYLPNRRNGGRSIPPLKRSKKNSNSRYMI